ncbi:hypothetical protein O3G_MSEX007823 [Manduca sexta]|uniref:Uncharacterized protein n=1 Tax=Manduca sexta TaxID=7130 RepID=A0A921Z7M8_MANSE|nr:hypothetical protein O3G_MSEX007823 [Manduca sexta]
MKWLLLIVLCLCLCTALAMPYGYSDAVSTEKILSRLKRYALRAFAECPQGYVRVLKECIKINDEDYDDYE